MCMTLHLAGDNVSCQWSHHSEMAVKQDCKHVADILSLNTVYNLVSSANNLIVTPIGARVQISLTLSSWIPFINPEHYQHVQKLLYQCAKSSFLNITVSMQLWSLIHSNHQPLWFCLTVWWSVCPHDKTKMAVTNIAKLGSEIAHHDASSTNEY